MLPTTHPIVKTDIDLRRAINRLQIFQEQNVNDPLVVNGIVDSIISGLKTAKNHIPKDLIDNEA